MEPNNLETRARLERQLLFKPCPTKEELQRWIVHFLGLDLPDCTVDESSNSNPLDFVWELYKQAVYDNDPDFDRILAYANRGGYKTLSASVIEILMVFHDQRSVVHLASVEEQSVNCLEYVKKQLRKPAFSPFITQNDARGIQITRYECQGVYLTPKEYQALPELKKLEFQELVSMIEIVVATPQSVNGKHSSFFCLDEIDLLDSDIVYQEASGIPVESRGKYPITFLTSTRKKATGRVQAEIDDAHKNGLRVRHWNQIDLTQRCPESRHLPDEPKVVRYIDDDKLTHISEQEYEALADTEKAKLSPVEAFSGCVKNCKMLAACKTRLATHQKSTSQFLSSIPFTQNKVTKGSIEFIKSQILCRKPLSTGAIFNRFSRDKHILTAKDIYRRIEQQEPPTIFGKAELISHLLASPDIKFYGGMDFGYNHEFVAVVAAKVGIDFYIIECLAATELETTECIEYCKPLLKYRADFYPDPENPTLISSFRKARFNMLKWEKSKGSVIAGIEAVRAKLNPGPNAEPQLYLLMEDSGCGLLAEAFEKWSWKLNAAGEPTETPREEYKDRCDVVRYMILNAAPIKSKVYRPTENRKLPPKPQSISDRFWAAVKEDVHLKGVEIDPTPPDSDTPRRRKKFFY